MPTATQQPPTVFQGIEVPAEAVNPAAFFSLTRRKRGTEHSATFAGLGGTDAVELRKSDILSAIRVRFSGTVKTTGSTVKPTYAWPYNLIKRLRFTANGQSNLVSASGLAVKAREFMGGNVTDRGVVQKVGSSPTSYYNGTLSTDSEQWGPSVDKTAGAKTYDVELEWTVPVAEDPKDLAGAIFAQTSSQDLVLHIDWASSGDLFGGVDASDTVTVDGKLIVETEKYSIPYMAGHLVLPDLSLFHSYIESRETNISTGTNEIRLAGQGAGRQLLRMPYRVVSGDPAKPLAVTDGNFGPQSWRYGSNETPETYAGGRSIRQVNEQEYGSDIAGLFGWMAHEFNVTNAFRDSVNMGQTSELRLVCSIDSSVSLTNPALEYVQETMFQA